MKGLLIIVPSRGRPDNAARLLEAFQDTREADSHLLFGLDADDPELESYQRISDIEYVINHGGLRQVTAILNWMLIPELVDEYRAIGHVGDDQGYPTEGWDLRVMESLETNLFCFADDLYPRAKGSLCCHIFMRSEVVKKLGYFATPTTKHMFCDVAWMAWGKATSIEFLADVIWPHLHYTLGHPQDESNQLSMACTPGDLEAFNRYCHEQLNADIAKLGGQPYSPAELARFKKDLYVPCSTCEK